MWRVNNQIIRYVSRYCWLKFSLIFNIFLGTVMFIIFNLSSFVTVRERDSNSNNTICKNYMATSKLHALRNGAKDLHCHSLLYPIWYILTDFMFETYSLFLQSVLIKRINCFVGLGENAKTLVVSATKQDRCLRADNEYWPFLLLHSAYLRIN